MKTILETLQSRLSQLSPVNQALARHVITDPETLSHRQQRRLPTQAGYRPHLSFGLFVNLSLPTCSRLN